MYVLNILSPAFLPPVAPRKRKKTPGYIPQSYYKYHDLRDILVFVAPPAAVFVGEGAVQARWGYVPGL